jgi:two-component system NtrC family sensor kinase
MIAEVQAPRHGRHLSIAAKLAVSFLAVIAALSLLFMVVGVHLIGDLMLQADMLDDRGADIRSRTVNAFLAVTFTGAVGAMGLSYVMARPITRSLEQLVAASSDVARGNFEATVDISTNDEFEDLAESFNTMAAALRERDAQLKEMAENRVRKSERLAIVGQLAAGVAHELNNPLQGIVTYSLLMLEDMPDGDPNREMLQTIVTQAERCTKIVRGLLDFSRQKKSYKKPCDVTLVVDECLSLVEHQALFHNIAIERSFAEDLPDVVMDPAQIEQVLMNLIMNAAEAMEGEGLLRITVTHLRPQDMVAISVQDTGPGIPPGDLQKVFVPFFTTKEAGQGVGLGLAISYGIVEEHGGTITVESEVGLGTTFTVRLPVKVETPALEEAPS